MNLKFAVVAHEHAPGFREDDGVTIVLGSGINGELRLRKLSAEQAKKYPLGARVQVLVGEAQ